MFHRLSSSTVILYSRSFTRWQESRRVSTQLRRVRVNAWAPTVRYREEDVLLVLIDGARVGHRLRLLDDRDALAGEDRLVHAQRRRADLRHAQVRRHLVTRCTRTQAQQNTRLQYCTLVSTFLNSLMLIRCDLYVE